jgi:hypothetical protein
MTISSNEILPGGIQDANSGNAGDLGKHGAYLSLLAELRQHTPWRHDLQVVEAHSGKGLYAPAHVDWGVFEDFTHPEKVPLIVAQMSITGPEPVGIGPIAGLPPEAVAYAGSTLLNSRVLNTVRTRSLVCYDRKPNVRITLERVLREPCFDTIRQDVAIVDPGQHGSEPVVLDALRAGAYGQSHVLHLDPFAFVMSDDDQGVRDRYREIIQEADARVASGKLGAVSLFVTWGSNGQAARADLFQQGYAGGLQGGYQDLLSLVHPQRRITVSWCRMTYFSQILLVAEPLRDPLVARLNQDLARLRELCPNHFQIT